MPPKSRAAYCDLLSYVEAKHPDLYAAFNGVCLRDTLARGGITLIVPKDAKKLADDAWSEDPETIRATRERLLAHVLHGAHKELAATTDANTRQLQPRAVKLMKKGADGVTITTGPAGKTVQATAKIASDFSDASARNNNAVWIIESGDISPDGVVVTIRKPGAGGKSGGYALEDSRAASQRHQAVVKIERDAASAGGESAAREVFCAAARGLACCIHAKYPDLYYDTILPCLAHTYLDIYILLEPHKQEMAAYVVPDDCIAEWISGGMKTAKLAAYQATIDNVPRGSSSALIYSRPSAVVDALAAVRSDIVSKTDLSATLDAIKAAYGRLEAENAIGEAKGVLPEGACRKDKLALDDLRFWADVHLSQYLRDGDRGAVNGILNRIGDAMHSADPVRIVTSDALRSIIAPGDQLAMIRGFVNSVFFMSFPLQSSVISSISNYQSPTFGKYNDTFYNPLFGKDVVNHARVTGGAAARRTRIVGALKRAGFEPTQEQLDEIAKDF